MGRKPLNEDDLKQNINFRIKRSLIERLRKIPNYNSKVENLIEKFLDDNSK